MKYSSNLNLLLFCISVFAIQSCQEALPETKSFPVIRTLMPKDINELGTTFRAELTTPGTSPTTSYGFIWDTVEPDLATANKVELGSTIPEGEFEKRVESQLAKDVEYKVRVYAVQNGKTIYGNTISFISLGSKESTWGIEANVTGGGTFSAFGGTDGQYGYIIYQLGQSYRYDPVKKTLTGIADYPAAFNSGSQFAMCSFNGVLHVFGSNSNLYKFDNNTWSLVSPLPFFFTNFGGYYHAFSDNGIIYIISSFQSYAYDVANNFWYQLPQLPFPNTYSIAGAFYQGKGYLLMRDKTFWEFDLTTLLWTEKKEYPGISQERLVNFGLESKLYFGLQKNPELWVYDTSLNEWQSAEKFPRSLEDVGRQIHFVINNKLYYGIDERSGDYTIWTFQPKSSK